MPWIVAGLRSRGTPPGGGTDAGAPGGRTLAGLAGVPEVTGMGAPQRPQKRDSPLAMCPHAAQTRSVPLIRDRAYQEPRRPAAIPTASSLHAPPKAHLADGSIVELVEFSRSVR